MTFYPSDITGYVQGHRFDDTDPDAYDAATERFIDLAGYGDVNAITKVTGTPAFNSLGPSNRRGLRLDGSCQWNFVHAAPWHGTTMLVFRPTLASASVSQFPLLFGNAVTNTSNGNIFLSRSSGVNSIQARGPSAALSRSITGLVSGNIAVAVFSWNQEDRKMRSTQDAVTIGETSALASNTNSGINVGIGTGPGGSPATLANRFTRLGDLLGNGSTTPNTTDFIDFFEMWTWDGDVLASEPSKVAQLIAARRAYYGL